MARQFLRSTRALISVARNNIEILATLAAIAAGALVPLPSPSGGERSVTTVAAHTADAPRIGTASTGPARLVER